MTPGPTELLIIFAIVMILFGVGRISRLGGEIGSAVANFRRGVQSSDDAGDSAPETTPQP